MSRGGAAAPLYRMTDPEDELIERVTERYERRLAEELGTIRLESATASGGLRAEMERGNAGLRAEMERGDAALRVEMAHGFGAMRAEMERGFGALRAEMIDRNVTLLKWLLVYAVTQTAAIAALFRLFR